MPLLTPETIQATRQWFADNARACIAEVQSGEVRVNDLPAYTAWREESAAAALRGDYDRTLTFLQRATYIQTGDCPALLP
jgi:hypothetical protein